MVFPSPSSHLDLTTIALSKPFQLINYHTIRHYVVYITGSISKQNTKTHLVHSFKLSMIPNYLIVDISRKKNVIIEDSANIKKQI
jgi:hypothetical protein